MNVLGCRASDAILAAWEQRIVFEREPIFVTEAERRWLPAGSIILSAKEFADNFAMAPHDLWDSYRLYEMDRKGMEVALLTPAEFWELSEEARQELMALQAARGRGQIYPEAFLRKAEATLLSGARDRIATDDGTRFALRYDAWWALSPEERRRWLLHFVSENRNSCLSGQLSAEQWERIDRVHGPQIRLLAGTLSPVSGPNCFATALAAVTPNSTLGLSILGHWLHPEPFLRGLAERGFGPSNVPAEAESMAEGSVILFFDESKRLQHAAYYLGEGLVLNKDGQGWHIPRQIRPVAELLESWLADGMQAQTYSRR